MRVNQSWSMIMVMILLALFPEESSDDHDHDHDVTAIILKVFYISKLLKIIIFLTAKSL